MTDLAYMVRADWGQRGTAMRAQSAVIRDWIGAEPHLFAVTDAARAGTDDRDADVEAATYISPNQAKRTFTDFTVLSRLQDDLHDVVALHPLKQRDCETIRRVVEAGSIAKLFVLVWSRSDMMRFWLEGAGATNLHTREATPAVDPLLLSAARMIQNEDYNGLGAGRGKDAVVQLARAFAVEGYHLDPDPWLRAYFAVGGNFRQAESLEKLLTEMKAGTRHRVTPRYREDIVAVLRQQLIESTDR